MIKFRDILSTSNFVILMIMAGGNLILGIIAYDQEFQRMNCVRQAIYEHATQDGFTACLKQTGFFDVYDSTNLIYLQFVLIMTSIVISYVIEKK